MYFSEQEVCELLHRIAARLPGAQLYFDAIPPWLSRRTLKGLRVTRAYNAPPMPWGISVGRIAPFVEATGSWSVSSVQTYGDAFPHRTRLFHLLAKVPWTRNMLAPGLVHAVAEAPGTVFD